MHCSKRRARVARASERGTIICLHAGSECHPEDDEEGEDMQMLSRRSFLNSMLGAGLGLTTAHQATAQTPAVQPPRRRLIVDAQVHWWSRRTGRRFRA